MMPISRGNRPLADFSEPIEMLKDCHRRIEHFPGVLRTAEQRYGADDFDDRGRCALEAALNFFSNFAPLHTADEEQSLFPRMRCSDDPQVRAVMADLDLLEEDHRRCEAGHELVDANTRHWLETGRLDDDRRRRLHSALDELSGVDAAHIRVEEQRVLAVAGLIPGADDVRAIGREMRERRSLSGSAPGSF